MSAMPSGSARSFMPQALAPCFWPSLATVRATAFVHGVGAPKMPQPRLSRMHCLAAPMTSAGRSS